MCTLYTTFITKETAFHTALQDFKEKQVIIPSLLLQNIAVPA